MSQTNIICLNGGEKMKKAFMQFICVIMVCMTMVCYGSTTAYALDGVGADSSNSSSVNQDGSGTGDATMDALTDYMKGYNAVTDEDMQKASRLTSPLSRLIGQITGAILLLTVALMFMTTALDLMYIAVPFVRRFLNPQDMAQGGGGMGMGGYGMRGMGMGGMGGQQQTNQRKWVSDECIAAMTEAGAGGAQQGMGGGMGMGGYGMGGMGMAGQQQAAPTKAVISTYLKKRIFFLVVFGLASMILMSSILLDCGINLAELLYKIIGMLNDGIANTQI